MRLFLRYLCLDICVWLYLACWGIAVPLVIIKQGGVGDLALYETSLALAAVISMMCLASTVEAMRRTTALKLACTVVVAASLLRYCHVSMSYSLVPLMAIDVLAVSAFGVIQPLLAVYPAEVVAKDRVESAFRIRRIATTMSRVAGPLVAGLVIAVWSTSASLLLTAILGVVILGLSVTFPASSDPKVLGKKKMLKRFQDMFLGVQLKFALPPERFFTVSDVLLGVATAATLPLLIPGIVHAYALGEEQLGLLSALFAAGSVSGLMFLSPVLAKKRNQQKKFACLWLLLAFSLIGSACSESVWALAPLLFIAGAATACLSLIGTDKRTLSVPSEFRIRLNAATLVVGQLANAASYVIVGATVSRFGYGGLWVFYAVVLLAMLFCVGISTRVWRFLEDSGDSAFYYQNHHPTLTKNMFR